MRDALEMGQAVPGRVRGTAATLRYFVSIESRRSIALAA
jgi:hypothetical protein